MYNDKKDIIALIIEDLEEVGKEMFLSEDMEFQDIVGLYGKLERDGYKLDNLTLVKEKILLSYIF